VGGVSEGATRKPEEEKSSLRFRAATVEDTLVHGTPAAFAGCLQNVGLGRSVLRSGRSLPRRAGAPATAGVLWKPQEGNVVGVRIGARTRFGGQRVAASRTRPSLGPETRARHASRSTRRRKLSRGAWHDRFDIVVGQARESGKNRHRGRRRSDACAARRASPLFGATRRGLRDASEKEEGRGLRPCEENESSGSVPVRRMQLQKSEGGIWPRISSYAALPKEWRFE